MIIYWRLSNLLKTFKQSHTRKDVPRGLTIGVSSTREIGSIISRNVAQTLENTESGLKHEQIHLERKLFGVKIAMSISTRCFNNTNYAT